MEFGGVCAIGFRERDAPDKGPDHAEGQLLGGL